MKTIPSFSKINRRTWVIGSLISIVIILFLLLGWYLLFFNRDSGHRPAVSTPVQVQEVIVGNFPLYFSSLGTVTAANTVTVRSRVDGELFSLYFSEGQKVKEGDLLAKIDPRPFQAQLTQAQGQLVRDKALLLNAQQNLARSNILFAQDSATQQDVDTNKALVRQYEGAIKVDKGQIDAAQLQLEFSSITAPVSGKLGLRTVDAGNMVYTTDTAGLVVITQVQPINVLFTVTDAQLPIVLQSMRAGHTLPVEAWDRTQKNLLAAGKLVSIDNQIDTSTGTVKVKAEFTNEDDILFPNQFVNARIRVGTAENALIAPTAAVQFGNQGSFVYVVGTDNRVALRLVEIGSANDTQTVITKGVKAGDQLVIDGLDRLRDKSLVTIASSNSEKTPDNTDKQKTSAVSPSVVQEKQEEKPSAIKP